MTNEQQILTHSGGSPVNTEQMYAFLAVYETQSFSAASRQLIKSQSAVTQLIKSLETELNAPLFLRHVRPITPTQAARTFYPYAHEVMRMINEGIQAVQKKSRERSLSFLHTE